MQGHKFRPKIKAIKQKKLIKYIEILLRCPISVPIGTFLGTKWTVIQDTTTLEHC